MSLYDCTFTQLDQTGHLLIRGPDAAKFLQGQVTCDINELDNAQVRLGAQCNQKGRVLISFTALKLAPELIALKLPRSMIEVAQKTLGKYIVFSKAKIELPEQEFVHFGLLGPDAQVVAEKIFATVPASDATWSGDQQAYIIRHTENRFEISIEKAQVKDIALKLEKLASKTPPETWDLAQIEAGIAQIDSATSELFTPQDLNYQLINAVNFRKGCYTGQEIIARLHYRGTLKRHLYRYQLATNTPPAPGTEVSTPTKENAIGNIINCAQSGDGLYAILASVFDEYKDDAYIKNSTEKLERHQLPYAIPSAEN